MSLAEDMKRIAGDIISLYEARLKSLGHIFDATHQSLNESNKFLVEIKKEREKISAELRESLAKEESLRRKDFDDMMNGFITVQNNREEEIKDLLKGYHTEQEDLASTLRDIFEKTRDALMSGENQRIEEFQIFMKEVLERQEERKKEVISRLKEFQSEQGDMMRKFWGLLKEGSESRLKELKSMLREFETQNEARMARQERRRQEVRNLIGEFKNERLEGAMAWRTIHAYKHNQPEKYTICPQQGAKED